MPPQTYQTECTSSRTPSGPDPSSAAKCATALKTAINPYHSSSPSKGRLISYASIILYVFALVFVTLRLYVRCLFSKTHGVDDYLIIAATLLVTIGTSMMLMQVAYGWGKHTSELTLEQLNQSQLYLWIFILSSYLSLFTIHKSICCLLLRMMRGATTFGKECRMCIWAVMIFVIIRSLIQVVVHTFQCSPINRFWEVQLRSEGCLNIGLWSLLASYLNSLTELILFLLPIPLIYKLQVPLKKKVSMFIIFLAGLIPVAASLIRSTHLTQSYIDMGEWLQRDSSWNWAFVTFWFQVETTLGIIAACVPTFNPLLSKLFHWLGFRTSSNRSQDQHSNNDEPITTSVSASSIDSAVLSKYRRRNSHTGVSGPLSTGLAALNMLDLEDIYPPRYDDGDDVHDGLDAYFRAHARMAVEGTGGGRRASGGSHRSAPPRLDFARPPPPAPKAVVAVAAAAAAAAAGPSTVCSHAGGGTDARDFGAVERRDDPIMRPRCAGALRPSPPRRPRDDGHARPPGIGDGTEPARVEPGSPWPPLSKQRATTDEGEEEEEGNTVEISPFPSIQHPRALTAASTMPAGVVTLDSELDTDMGLERGERRDESVGGVAWAPVRYHY